MSESSVRYVPEKCVFEATLKCNLNCLHCGSSAGKARPDELSTAEAARVFQDLAALGGKRVTIGGGEPTTRLDWLELIRHAASAGLKVGMITNALKFDEVSAVAARQNGLGSVGFSVDGLGPVHDKTRGRLGHFNQIMEAMEAAKNAEIPFAVISCLHTENVGSLDEMHRVITGKGAFAWQVQIGSDMGNLHHNSDLILKPNAIPELQETLARLIRKSKIPIYVSDSIGYFGPHEQTLRRAVGGRAFGGCGAGIRNLGIESNGNVKGCLSIWAGYNPEGEGFVEGNVRERSLIDIWNDENAFAYNRQWIPERLEGFCRDCQFGERCRGGCMSHRTTSGAGEGSSNCAFQILYRQTPERRSVLVATAAAALLAAVGTASCESVAVYDDPVPVYGYPEDTETETDTDTETETETATDSEVDGGDPDGGVDYYGMPSPE